MNLLKSKPKPIVEVIKLIEDLRGLDDVLHNPRSWSPDELKEACNNISFEANFETEPIENLTIQYIFKHFFYMMHQTGLYNPQKKLWSLIAQAKTIKYKPYKRIPKKDREQTKVSDFIIEDAYGKFVKVRLVHPQSSVDLPGIKDLMSSSSGKCVGIIYISDKEPGEEIVSRIRAKTNFKDNFDQYRSPINENCCFDLVVYQPTSDGINYQLRHPDLAKTDSTKSFVPAESLEAFAAHKAFV